MKTKLTEMFGIEYPIVQSGMQGYVDSRGVADIDKRDEYIAYGDKVIKAVIG